MKRFRNTLGLVVVGLCAAAAMTWAPDAWAQVDETQVRYDGILDAFRDQAPRWQGVLSASAMYLFFLLATIQTVWTNGMLALKGGDLSDFIAQNTKHFLGIGVMYVFLIHSFEWSTALVMGFRQAGERAVIASAGGAAEPALDPAGVFQNGLIVAGSLFAQTSVWSGADNLALVFCALVIVVCFSFLAAFMAVAIIESYIVIGGSVLLLGFGGSTFTADIAKRTMMYAVSVGAKLFVMQLIVGVAMGSVIMWAQTYEQDSSTSTLSLIGLVILITICAKMIPDIVQGLLSGVSVGGSAAMVGTIAAAAAAAATAGAALVTGGAALAPGAAAAGAAGSGAAGAAGTGAVGAATTGAQGAAMHTAGAFASGLGQAAKAGGEAAGAAGQAMGPMATMARSGGEVAASGAAGAASSVGGTVGRVGGSVVSAAADAGGSAAGSGGSAGGSAAGSASSAGGTAPRGGARGVSSLSLPGSGGSGPGGGFGGSGGVSGGLSSGGSSGSAASAPGPSFLSGSESGGGGSGGGSAASESSGGDEAPASSAPTVSRDAASPEQGSAVTKAAPAGETSSIDQRALGAAGGSLLQSGGHIVDVGSGLNPNAALAPVVDLGRGGDGDDVDKPSALDSGYGSGGVIRGDGGSSSVANGVGDRAKAALEAARRRFTNQEPPKK